MIAAPTACQMSCILSMSRSWLEIDNKTVVGGFLILIEVPMPCLYFHKTHPPFFFPSRTGTESVFEENEECNLYETEHARRCIKK